MAVTRPLRMRTTAAQRPGGTGGSVRPLRLGRPQHVGADGVAGLDVGDPLDLDLRPGELLEQGQLMGAGGRPGPGHPGDGAVVLADHEAAVAGAGAVGHVAVLVLDGGQGRGQLGQGAALGAAGVQLGQLLLAVVEQPLHGLGPQLRGGRLQQLGDQLVVVAGEQVVAHLGQGVDVGRPAAALGPGGLLDQPDVLQHLQVAADRHPRQGQGGAELRDRLGAVALEQIEHGPSGRGAPSWLADWLGHRPRLAPSFRPGQRHPPGGGRFH